MLLLLGYQGGILQSLGQAKIYLMPSGWMIWYHFWKWRTGMFMFVISTKPRFNLCSLILSFSFSSSIFWKAIWPSSEITRTSSSVFCAVERENCFRLLLKRKHFILQLGVIALTLQKCLINMQISFYLLIFECNSRQSLVKRLLWFLSKVIFDWTTFIFLCNSELCVTSISSLLLSQFSFSSTFTRKSWLFLKSSR